ncbi:uncharacterized protein LOC131651005 [Vicia villosa]|uniref:uncharacterized protein LOC131651005 n=1 Tax=Vicia villosa TaxID=3911 RepID=UPI00273C6FEB|nr:uncharacterized protein LOC131651005 [Vicia villosa]
MIDVLEMVEKDGINLDQKSEALFLMKYMQSFKLIFILHLMRKVLGITRDLSQALQKSDQYIVNAMKLVKVSKNRLQAIRDNGWDSLFNEVSLFCEYNGVDIPNMDDTFQSTHKKSKRKIEFFYNLHHFQVQLFYDVIDRQLQELNNRFTEVNSKLLLCVACLSLRHSFSSFDKEKLIRLAQFYPSEFSQVELLALDCQLENYFLDVCSDNDFSKLEGISDLVIKLVETKKYVVYPLVYLLLELSLILPVATATTERAFSAMDIIKNRMRNRMGDEWLNDCLVTYIERDIFVDVENEKIIQYFQNMKNCREEL